MPEIIEELSLVMKEKNLSTTIIACLVGCTSRTIERWLSGESKPTNGYQILIKQAIKKARKE